jgi:hypothetical protein
MGKGKKKKGKKKVLDIKPIPRGKKDDKRRA